MAAVPSLPAQRPGASPAQAASQLREAWVAALGAQSLDAIVPLYSEDAVLSTAATGRVEGREAISNVFVQVFALAAARFSLTSRSVNCSGTLCVDEGTYQQQITLKGNKQVVSATGDYLHVLRRDPDGQWRLLTQVLAQTPGDPLLKTPPPSAR